MTQPQWSPDGRWWWDGAQWVPAAPQPTSAYPQTPYAGWPAYPAPPSTHDGKAIASLVLSIIGCGIGSIAGVVLGHLSRSEARRQGREPSGMALAGLIIGYIGVAALAVVILVFAIGAGVSGSFDSY